jgi:hypothetical protein
VVDLVAARAFEHTGDAQGAVRPGGFVDAFDEEVDSDDAGEVRFPDEGRGEDLAEAWG